MTVSRIEKTYGSILRSAQNTHIYISTFTDYTPPRPELTTAGFENLINQVLAANADTARTKQDYHTAVDNRIKAFRYEEDSLEKKITKLTAYLNLRYGKNSLESRSANRIIVKLKPRPRIQITPTPNDDNNDNTTDNTDNQTDNQTDNTITTDPNTDTTNQNNDAADANREANNDTNEKDCDTTISIDKININSSAKSYTIHFSDNKDENQENNTQNTEAQRRQNNTESADQSNTANNDNNRNSNPTSVSQNSLSYGSKTANFRDLINTLESFPDYQPLEQEFTVQGLTDFANQLDQLSNNVTDTDRILKSTRKTKKKLYVNLRKATIDIKAYVLYKYGTSSDEYNAIKDL